MALGSSRREGLEPSAIKLRSKRPPNQNPRSFTGCKSIFEKNWALGIYKRHNLSCVWVRMSLDVLLFIFDKPLRNIVEWAESFGEKNQKTLSSLMLLLTLISIGWLYHKIT